MGPTHDPRRRCPRWRARATTIRDVCPLPAGARFLNSNAPRQAIPVPNRIVSIGQNVSCGIAPASAARQPASLGHLRERGHRRQHASVIVLRHCWLSCSFAALALPVAAQGYHQLSPNDYRRAVDDNRVTALDRRLERGELELPANGASGRLLPLLQALGVPVASQVLVFSRTSLQRHRLGPGNPRAIYFGAEVYVGYVPGAKAIEVAATDARLGLVFYTLTQQDELPRLRRDDSCLSCHASPHTNDEPGLLLRSVFVDRDGDPIASAGETAVDTGTPLAERWGGWLVTGQFTGAHRGNGFAVRDERGNHRVLPRPAADLRAFADWFDAASYPVPTSDIAALLVLEHQVTVHNAMVQALLPVPVLLRRDEELGRALGETGLRPTTERLLDDLARRVAAALLLAHEPSLATHTIAPAPAFAAAWPPAPRDAAGTALGVLDLRQRLFTEPLSPLVHGELFAALPAALRDRVLARLWTVLRRGRLPGGVELTFAERQRLHEHLRQLLPGYAAAAPAVRRR